MFDGLFTRVCEHLILRPAGPLKFRFLLQPAMAIFLAVRSGLKDSQEGKPAFFWALFVDRAHCRELLRDAWKSIGKLLILTVVLVCAYQIIVLRWIYPFETLVVVLFLAVIPYLLVRGPVNRIASARKSADQPADPVTIEKTKIK